MNNPFSKSMDEAIKIINENNNIFIASHINPDGDNLGSQLALYLGLKKLNKNVIPLMSDLVPEDFLFLPGAKDIVKYQKDLGDIDVFIAVDSSDEDRLGDNKELLSKAKHIINIDHHATNTFFGDVNIVDPNSPATGELVYKILSRMDNLKIDKDMATNIYTAINTDTGKFSYSSVTGETHRIAADLIDKGVDLVDIDIKLYQNKSMEKINLFAKAMSDLKMYNNNKIGLIRVTQKLLDETNTSMEDTNGLVENIRQIKGLEVAILLKEEANLEIKASLRSKNNIDVAKICEQFNGGGHKAAAGCTIEEDIDTAEDLIINETAKYLKK